MEQQTRSNRSYFAAEPPSSLTGKLLEKVDDFDRYILSTRRINLWRRSYTYYNRAIFKDGRLNQVGEQSEYTEIYINHFRNILTHILNMVTEQPPSFDARAANTDYRSQAETIVANNVLEYYARVKGMGKIAKTAVEDVLQFADGYVYQGWDFSLGDPAMPDPKRPGAMIKQGDIFHKNFTPIDTIFDYTSGLLDASREWYILRDFQNKWNLAERYPELREKILDIQLDTASSTPQSTRLRFRGKSPEDLVPVYLFMHDRTDAMPDGRYFVFLSRDIWFVDSGLPAFYKNLPVHRLCASEQRGSGFGYSIAFDLLPAQEAIDGLYSTIITNQSTFGVQNIMMPKGAGIQVSELTDGLNLIEYDPKLGKPEPLELLSTPKEIFEFIRMLEAVQEAVSGVNSVARGNPESSLKSGSALALVQAMALQFMSGLQSSYVHLLESLGMGTISILQACATTPRMIEISGKVNKSYVKEFSQKEIANINRVIVDVGNPLSRTTAGRIQIADNLLQNRLIDNAEQYLQVMETGKLENLTEGKQSELMLMRAENEMLSNGQKVTAAIIDNHLMHVTEHRAVIASPLARQDPRVVSVTLEHIQNHIELWQQMPPALLAMIGLPPAPPPGPSLAPGIDAATGVEQVNPAGQMVPEEAIANSQLPAPVNPTEAAGEHAKLPAMPVNPLTHKRSEPIPTGGAK